MNLSQLKQEFENQYGKGGEILSFFGPGRVNLIGEHIDYNGGFVFPAALTIGITALWRKKNDYTILLKSMNAPGEVKIELESDLKYRKEDGWGNYPKGVFAYLRKNGVELQGGEMLFYSDLPDGAGLSSSAAIEVVTAFMMLSVTGANHIDKVWLAQLCQKVENEYIGVNCGIMDQFSVANGKVGHAILLDCQSLNFQLVPIQLGEYTLVIMNTNKRRELADSKYNERRAECDKVLAILNTTHSYKNLCETSLEEVNKLIKDPVLKKRARHVVTENQRVLESVEVLKQGNLKRFGELLNASHASLKDDYEVTGKELDAIVNEAQEFTDCLGARMTGAGFGGCAIALVKTSSSKEFMESVGISYEKIAGLHANFYVSSIGDGVHKCEMDIR